MHLKNKGAEIFIPDNAALPDALARTTHMSIAAHQDDIEILSCHGILECFNNIDKWFFGVVVTDGAGCARKNIYANFNDTEMRDIRKIEQKKSAFIGEYGAVALLDYSSNAIKDGGNHSVIDDLTQLIMAAKPQVIYTHNLADKHDAHVAVALRVIQSIRKLPKEFHPRKIIGCEVWRSLDWMNDCDKVMLDVSSHQNIADALLGVHDSQISGGKRYDLATKGRRLANATYLDAHSVDEISAITWGMDLTLLLDDISLDINEYVASYIDRFRKDVEQKVRSLL